nr:hypothetical protein [Tanacetum cinerariifolium]
VIAVDSSSGSLITTPLLRLKAAKRRRLNKEDKDMEEIKQHLEIVPDEDDDVYTEATPLARKLILLVERRYPLLRFTLDQILNVVRLQVKEQSEMYLELISSSMEESKSSLWFSKVQELETVRVLWSAYYHIHLYLDDLASREKISTFKVHSGSTDQHSLELMLLRTSRRICQLIKTAGEELLLPSKIDADG